MRSRAPWGREASPLTGGSMRRILFAAALAALLPVAASAQSRSHAPVASTSVSPNMTASVLVGMEDLDPGTGLALRVDGVMDVKYLAPKVKLSGVVSVGFMHWGDSSTFNDGFTSTKSEQGLNIFKLVPAARFTFDVAPQLDL